MIVDRARHGNCRKFGTDFAVPLERNRDLYNYYRERCDAVFPNQYTIFGHIGDANVHVNLLPDTDEGAVKAEALMEDFANYVVSLGGTVAAEHGIGKLKTNLLKLMYSEDEINAMRDVKRHLDPGYLLGRGSLTSKAIDASLYPNDYQLFGTASATGNKKSQRVGSHSREDL